MPPPPDLSSHRLPAETSLRIFQSEILPAEFLNLPRRGSSEPPLAILAVGQTGAGKTRLSPAILSAVRLARGGGGGGSAAHLIADTYKTYHPEYARLMLSAPHLASAATGPDARKWLAMAAREVTGRAIDVLVESACRHPEDFEDLVRIFSSGGYRVEVVLLAVPAPLSRLGILVRYYEKLPGELPGGQSRNLPVRLTPERVHDDSYRGLLDAARFLDVSALADQVLVVRRGNLVAYGVVKGEGEGTGMGGIAEALTRERERPLTRDEVKTAMNDIQRLGTHEDAREQVDLVRDLLRPLIVEDDGKHAQGQKGTWPELKPLTFGKVGEEAGGAYNILRLGQV
ncbi:hypothetical protein C2857_004783 [Epichloe festucae Fl1]|uniref:Zeta toxin domain-containing protein n=1 Tax=Epichloe festucae (strain Fl1) TaxID=877507 RepID=A0A7U3Q1X2_EPIFF|nr:hypothetical protein C2857_004783 [Epichloe festucae Fl1]